MADRARRGFALVTVLWVLAAASVVMLRSTLAGRDAFNSARNRTLLTRATWKAEACLEVARSMIDADLSAAGRVSASARWSLLEARLRPRLDSLQAATSLWQACELTMHAAGARADINLSSRDALGALLRETIGGDRVDLVDALIDWRDTDDVPLPFGAERAWYAGELRPWPPNGPMGDAQELSLVRGFEAAAVRSRVGPHLGVEEGTVSLNNAPFEVLRTIPGISREAALQILADRARGHVVSDLMHVLGAVSQSAADTLLRNFPDAVRLSVLEPHAWTLGVRSRAGSSAIEATVEMRIVRTSDRAAIVRRRNWP